MGTDYLSIKTATQLLDARLDSIAIGLTPARQGGRSAKAASETFKARLAEFEISGDLVTLRSRIPVIEVTGVIDVVAADHIEVRCPEPIYLPLEGIFAAIRPLPQ